MAILVIITNNSFPFLSFLCLSSLIHVLEEGRQSRVFPHHKIFQVWHWGLFLFHTYFSVPVFYLNSHQWWWYVHKSEIQQKGKVTIVGAHKRPWTCSHRSNMLRPKSSWMFSSKLLQNAFIQHLYPWSICWNWQFLFPIYLYRSSLGFFQENITVHTKKLAWLIKISRLLP